MGQRRREEVPKPQRLTEPPPAILAEVHPADSYCIRYIFESGHTLQSSLSAKSPSQHKSTMEPQDPSTVNQGRASRASACNMSAPLAAQWPCLTHSLMLRHLHQVLQLLLQLLGRGRWPRRAAPAPSAVKSGIPARIERGKRAHVGASKYWERGRERWGCTVHVEPVS